MRLIGLAVILMIGVTLAPLAAEAQQSRSWFESLSSRPP